MKLELLKKHRYSQLYVFLDRIFSFYYIVAWYFFLCIDRPLDWLYRNMRRLISTSQFISLVQNTYVVGEN